jgi:hypothetical protein
VKIRIASFLNIIVGFSFVWRIITESVSLPAVLSFIPDALLILAIVICYTKHAKANIQDKKFLMFVISLVLISIAGFIANFQGIESFFYYIWGARNQGRFLFFYLLAIWLLQDMRYFKFKRLVYTMLIVEIIIVSIQFFIMGYRNDYVSGIFGTEQGGNGVVNIFICIITIWVLVDFLHKEISAKRAIALIGACLYIAAISEIKYYFIEMILFVSITVLVTDNGSRKIKIVAGVAIGLLFGLHILGLYYPYFARFFTLENLIAYMQKGAFNQNTATEFLTGYSRTAVLPGVYDTFLNGNILKTLFGVGLGYADSSPIALFNSSFSEKYGILLYANYHFSMVFLEMGFVGLIVFVSSFVGTIAQGISTYQASNRNNKYALYIFMMGILGLMVFFYDSSLRTSASGYFYYYSLAVSFIYMKKNSHSVQV